MWCICVISNECNDDMQIIGIHDIVRRHFEDRLKSDARYVENTKWANKANDVAKHFKILVKNCCNFKIVMLLWYGSHIDGGKK